MNEQITPKKEAGHRNLWIALLGVLVLLIAGFLVWAYLNNRATQLGPDHSQSFAILSRDHINPGDPHPPYNSNPPTSGWHYPNPADETFYDHSLPDEQVVHNLEHGDIWISYRHGVSQDVVSALKSLAGGYVIVTERDTDDHDVALAAWGRLDTFNLENGKLDMKRVQDFITRYKNQGPEKVPHHT